MNPDCKFNYFPEEAHYFWLTVVTPKWAESIVGRLVALGYTVSPIGERERQALTVGKASVGGLITFKTNIIDGRKAADDVFNIVDDLKVSMFSGVSCQMKGGSVLFSWTPANFDIVTKVSEKVTESEKKEE